MISLHNINHNAKQRGSDFIPVQLLQQLHQRSLCCPPENRIIFETLNVYLSHIKLQPKILSLLVPCSGSPQTRTRWCPPKPATHFEQDARSPDIQSA
jgi:hypothetical protein